MGTWGIGAFESDGAADWLGGLEEAESEYVTDALKQIAKAKPLVELDLDDAVEALAAAEVVAAARGHAPKSLPDSVTNWIAEQKFSPDPMLSELAANVVERVSTDSELQQEWDDQAEWKKALANLVQRLRAPAKTKAPSVSKSKEKKPRSILSPMEAAKKKLGYRIGWGDLNEQYDPRQGFAGTKLTDKDMELISQITSLEVLVLGEAKISPAGLEKIAGLKLNCINLGSSTLTDEFGPIVGGMNLLKQLFVANTRITDAFLGHVAKLTRLEELDLSETAITDEGLKHLKPLTSLGKLLLGQTKVKGPGLTELNSDAPLTHVALYDTAADDSAAKALSHFDKMTWLSLNNTRITDAAVTYLAKLQKLKHLNVAKTRLTKTGVKRLRESLPQTKIIAD